MRRRTSTSCAATARDSGAGRGRAGTGLVTGRQQDRLHLVVRGRRRVGHERGRLRAAARDARAGRGVRAGVVTRRDADRPQLRRRSGDRGRRRRRPRLRLHRLCPRARASLPPGRRTRAILYGGGSRVSRRDLLRQARRQRADRGHGSAARGPASRSRATGRGSRSGMATRTASCACWPAAGGWRSRSSSTCRSGSGPKRLCRRPGHPMAG